jgi:hypothetical protein
MELSRVGRLFGPAAGFSNGTDFYRTGLCIPCPPALFATLLARAGVTQAAFARLTGVSSRQVNNWCRGRATVPRWAAILAAALQDHSQDALIIAVEDALAAWRATSDGL